MADTRIRAVVIDDQDVVRTGLSVWCHDSDPPIDVVASGPTVDTALAGPGREADVVILDLHLRRPDPSLQGLRRLVESGHNVVIYTHDVSPTIARRCIRSGAKAYVNKGEVEDHLMPAVHEAAAGRSYTSPMLGAAILSDPAFGSATLSDQELRALKTWCGAKSMRVVAESMGVAESTAKTHIKRVRAKYEATGRPARSKAELIRRALEDGLLDLDDIGGEDWRE